MSQLFLYIPGEEKIFRLTNEGKKEIPLAVLPEPVPMIFLTEKGEEKIIAEAFYRISPSDINCAYYDGGEETYRLLHSVLSTYKEVVRAPSDTFWSLVKLTAHVMQMNQPATIFIRDIDGKAHRVTYNPDADTYEALSFDLPMLFDDCRIGQYQELYDQQLHDHKRRLEILDGLFDPQIPVPPTTEHPVLLKLFAHVAPKTPAITA